MAIGPFISMLLRMLPDILFLWRRRTENQDKEQDHDMEQEFRGALRDRGSDGGGDLDCAADLLERRLREARRVRERGS